ncbi:ParB N-terminal domain-containing protein [Nostoc sp. 106C]|uniref:ParB/RepB/Spo0J family partition protein n=1 Tax=Nostoc sp. 106C TaxID=1932667 RepID=UPI000A38C6DA|nr:ParB N-terminal domain-containing protein [Nostoc sp. 106C]OUL27098.1 hypothetical protein BV378_10510 [Nostoc sp. RF31YmG]OUL27628.1 hypothetical protein BV375_19725 [Nostoc sp. 106C]
MVEIILKKRKVVELHPHPKNEGIYGDEDIKELAELIEKYGLRKPLIVTPEGTIISGHRRWKAILFLGWETVLVEEKEFTDETAELEALLLENASREKTIEQKCREGLMWEAIERAKSRKRIGRKGLGVGSTRDVIAKKVGLGSGVNYEHACKVISAIDEAFLIGNIDKAETLRKFLNEKSVNAAVKMIRNTQKILHRKSINADVKIINDIESNIRNFTETQHTQTQWVLAKLGKQLCGSVWIDFHDRSRIWENEKLGSLSIDSFPSLGMGNEARQTVEYIDVVWLSSGNQIAAAFEIEITTPIYSGLLRMADLVTLCPNLNFPLYLVVPESRINKVKKELTRPTFKNLKLDQKCRYIILEKLLEKWDVIMEFATEPSALKSISQSCDSDS